MNEKQEYQRKMRDQFDAWKADLDALKARSDIVSAEARAEFDKRVDLLKNKMDEVGKLLSQIAAASDESWTSVKNSIDSSWGSWKRSFEEALTRLKQ